MLSFDLAVEMVHENDWIPSNREEIVAVVDRGDPVVEVENEDYYQIIVAVAGVDGNFLDYHVLMNGN